MSKSPGPVERQIAKIAREAAEDAAERRLDVVDGAALDGFVAPPVPAESETPVLDSLMETVPRGEGVYLKLYREIPGGQWELKTRIDDYSGWRDMEHEVTTIVRNETRRDARRWGSGKYKIQVVQDGKRGPKLSPIFLNIDAQEAVDVPRPNAVVADPRGDAKQQISEMAELLASVKTLMGPQSDPAMTQKMLADAFRSGLDVAPRAAAEPPGNQLVAAIAMLKDLGLIQPPQPKSGGLLETITVLKELGLIGQPAPPKTDSIRETLGLLRELGIVGATPAQTGPEDPMAMFEKLGKVIEVVRPLIGGGGGEGFGEKPSIGLEIVKTIGPHVPRMVERITGSIDRVAEVSRLRLAGALGTPPPAPHALPSPRTAAPAAHPGEAALPSPPPPPIPADNGVSEMHPVIREVYDAIQRDDRTFSPKLKGLLDTYVGPHIIPELISGRMTPEQFAGSLADTLQQGFFRESKSIEYLRAFVDTFSPPPSPPLPADPVNVVVGACPICNTEYEWPDKAAFDADDKKCQCGGVIVYVEGGQ